MMYAIEDLFIRVGMGVMVLDRSEEEAGEKRQRLIADSLSQLPTRDLLAKAVLEIFSDRIAVVSSFGAESAVLLGLIAEINPDLPILFVDTGMHFPETLEYRDVLTERLELTNLVNVSPDDSAVRTVDPSGVRHQYDPDGCCDLRKVRPLDKVLEGYEAWISGRKRFHGGVRDLVPTVELDGDKVKLNPLSNWGPEDVNLYMIEHDLPRHPLWNRGYLSIGCAVCTSPARPGEGPRSGRWPGFSKTECGIHEPAVNREAS